MSTYIVIPRRSPIAASFHRPLSEDDRSNVLAYQRRTNRDLLVSAGMSAEELTDGIYFRPAGSGDDEKLPPRSLDALGVLLIDDLANSHITALQASGATVVKNVEVEGTDPVGMSHKARRSTDRSQFVALIQGARRRLACDGPYGKGKHYWRHGHGHRCIAPGIRRQDDPFCRV